jgi:hypothetical protein
MNVEETRVPSTIDKITSGLHNRGVREFLVGERPGARRTDGTREKEGRDKTDTVKHKSLDREGETMREERVLEWG